MNKFGEFGDCFYKMGGDEFTDPAGRFLTELGLKFDFEDRVGEATDVGLGELVERVVYSDITASPVVSCSSFAVKRVLADQGELCVE